MSNVLVTGGSGFVAGWTIRKLIEKGYSVRTTVRSKEKGELVKSMLQHLNIDVSSFSYVIADLGNEKGWDDAMEGIDYVLHVASPLGGENHNDPKLIDTAKSGALYVLNAAIKAKVKKIVMTSSEAANYPKKNDTNQNVDETFWTDLNNKSITNYMRSKIYAEKLAWDLIKKQNTTQLATILPGAILGPFMDKRNGSTDQIFQMLLKGTPSPKVIYPVVDVRDLVDLHILAMENPKANGQRFIAESEEMTMPQMAQVLRNNMGEHGKKVSTMIIPNFVVTIGAKFNPAMSVLLTMMNLKYHRTNKKAKTLLNWKPRPAKETVIDTAEYLIDNNLI
ncbi:UDP-glucose 4-epimerase [Clostridium puniceum]|uniref:UDP-glucose 4-epimerase n=1 Tax=Clostridium puniceum TaxID=29367 RepID=A0A1S8TVA8_9CLOT|nr:NAD-dependent epimerase/dehydratase family protein [Clostridium puniceum]OOM81670.1 UDP-glucose 4-epimerase [Clostridium puniceum]